MYSLKGICKTDCGNVVRASIFQKPVLELATLCYNCYTRPAGIMKHVNLPLPRHVLCYSYSVSPFKSAIHYIKGQILELPFCNTVAVKNLTVKHYLEHTY